MPLAATALSRPIARLIQLGLIQRQLPFGENEKSSKKSLYTISDPFCHLWFQVIAPRLSLFENATSQGRKLLWRRYANAIFSYQWEVLCRSQIHRIRRIQELLPNDDCWMPAKRWWHENRPEWDIVTSNLTGDATLWGEVKWSETPFSCSQIRELALTLSSRDRFKVASKRMFHVLIVPSMESNAPSFVNDVVVLTAQDILDGSLEE